MTSIIPCKSEAIENQSKKLERMLEHFFSGQSSNTRDSYCRDLSCFQRFIGETTLAEACQAFLTLPVEEANFQAIGYRTYLMDQSYKPSTINRRISALRSLVKFANSVGMCSWRLTVKNVKDEPTNDLHGVTVPDFRKLLDIAAQQRNKRKAIRDTAILHVLLMGLRRNEVITIDIEDVDIELGCIWILSKGRKTKERLNFPHETGEALRAWIYQRGEAPGPLFLSCSRASSNCARLSSRGMNFLIKDLGKRAGIRIHTHQIRRTSITSACVLAQRNGLPLESVQKFSRHKDIRMVLHYRDFVTDYQGQIARMVSDDIVKGLTSEGAKKEEREGVY